MHVHARTHARVRAHTQPQPPPSPPQEVDRAKLQEAGCSAVFEPTSLYVTGVCMRVLVCVHFCVHVLYIIVTVSNHLRYVACVCVCVRVCVRVCVCA